MVQGVDEQRFFPRGGLISDGPKLPALDLNALSGPKLRRNPNVFRRTDLWIGSRPIRRAGGAKRTARRNDFDISGLCFRSTRLTSVLVFALCRSLTFFRRGRGRPITCVRHPRVLRSQARAYAQSWSALRGEIPSKRGGLDAAEAGEKAKLYQLRHPGAGGCQPVQGLVDRDQGLRPLRAATSQPSNSRTRPPPCFPQSFRR